MRAVVQRVTNASVSVDSKVVSSISRGLVVLVGITTTDTIKEAEWMAAKISKLKLFPDHDDVGTTKQWKRSVVDMNGDVLCISQFTLYAKVKKGSKPDFHLAAPGDTAQSIYNALLANLSSSSPSITVKDGVFGAMMQVQLVNDGPVTITLDTNE